MPSLLWPPPSLTLASEVDLNTWSGVEVFTRGTVGVDPAVTLPTFSSGADGYYEDALSLLCGRGSQVDRDLASELQTLWTAAGAAGNITCGIDADDYFYIESDTDDFTLGGSADMLTWFGFDSGGHGLVGGAAPYRRTAPNQWERGRSPFAGLSVDPAGATPAFSWPKSALPIHSVPTGLREVGVVADADDQHSTDCLETLDNDINDAGANLRRIRWGVDSTGRVYTSWFTGTTVLPTWQSTTFRDRLGFTGAESTSTSGSFTYLTATYPMPGLLFTSRPALRLHRWRRTTDHVVELTDGDVVGTHIATERGWDVRFRVDTIAAVTDLEEHFEEHFLSYVPPGGGVNVYPGGWFEPRRYRSARAAGSADPYTVLYSAEGEPPRARLRMKRDGGDNKELLVDYDGKDLALYHTVNMRLRHRVD